MNILAKLGIGNSAEALMNQYNRTFSIFNKMMKKIEKMNAKIFKRKLEKLSERAKIESEIIMLERLHKGNVLTRNRINILIGGQEEGTTE
jgi:hypothetical protein